MRFLFVCLVGLALAGISAACQPVRLCGSYYAPAPVYAAPVAVVEKVAVVQQTPQVVIVQQPYPIPVYSVTYAPFLYSPSFSSPNISVQSATYQQQVVAGTQTLQQAYVPAAQQAMPCPPGCVPATAKGPGSQPQQTMPHANDNGGGVPPADIYTEQEAKAFFALIQNGGCLKCHGFDTPNGAKGHLVLNLSDGSIPVFSPPERRAILERVMLPPEASGHMPPTSAPQLSATDLAEFRKRQGVR